MKEVIIPVLNNKGTSGDKQSTTNQAEENVDAFVDWSTQDVA